MDGGPKFSVTRFHTARSPSSSRNARRYVGRKTLRGEVCLPTCHSVQIGHAYGSMGGWSPRGRPFISEATSYAISIESRRLGLPLNLRCCLCRFVTMLTCDL